MIQNIMTCKLNVDEELTIKKNTLRGGDGKRIAIVTGIHGDELEGQYITYKLIKTTVQKVRGNLAIDRIPSVSVKPNHV